MVTRPLKSNKKWSTTFMDAPKIAGSQVLHMPNVFLTATVQCPASLCRLIHDFLQGRRTI